MLDEYLEKSTGSSYKRLASKGKNLDSRPGSEKGGWARTGAVQKPGGGQRGKHRGGEPFDGPLVLWHLSWTLGPLALVLDPLSPVSLVLWPKGLGT